MKKAGMACKGSKGMAKAKMGEVAMKKDEKKKKAPKKMGMKMKDMGY